MKYKMYNILTRNIFKKIKEWKYEFNYYFAAETDQDISETVHFWTSLFGRRWLIVSLYLNDWLLWMFNYINQIINNVILITTKNYSYFLN